MSTISEVKTNIQGRSRLDRFRITIPTPGGVVQEVLVKAAALPGRAIGVLEVKHRGATIKLGGEPTYNDWNITVHGEDYSEYERFFSWMDKIAEVVDNTRGNPSAYKINGVKVEQLGLDNNPISVAILDGVFPSTIGEIAFDHDTPDVVTFTVTLSIDSIKFEKV